jgi:hypothetical protein
MDQTRYSILSADFAARQAYLRGWSTDARRFATAFRDAFNSYLGSPDDFEDLAGHRRRVVRLTELVELNDHVALASQHDLPRPADRLVLNKDCEWVFAVEIHLAEDLSRQFFACQCRLELRDNIARLYIGDQKAALNLPVDDPATLEPALEALYNHFRTFLQQRPSSERKAQMGFLPRAMGSFAPANESTP